MSILFDMFLLFELFCVPVNDVDLHPKTAHRMWLYSSKFKVALLETGYTRTRG